MKKRRSYQRQLVDLLDVLQGVGVGVSLTHPKTEEARAGVDILANRILKLEQSVQELTKSLADLRANVANQDKANDVRFGELSKKG